MRELVGGVVLLRESFRAGWLQGSIPFVHFWFAPCSVVVVEDVISQLAAPVAT